MNRKVDISAIIVTYNSGHEIRECLSSLILSLKSYIAEIFIIDNASTDSTLQVVKLFQEKYAFISFIKNESNYLYTHAINQGLSLAKGQFVLLLNPDTVVPETTFASLIPEFSDDEKLAVVAPQFHNSDGSIQPSCRRFPKHRDILFHLMGLNYLFPRSKLFNGWKMGDFDHKTKKYVEQPQGAFILVRAEAIKTIGFLDQQFPMFFSDVDWCHRFILDDWKIAFIPTVAIVHHQGRSVFRQRIPMIWSSHKSFYLYFKKYYPSGIWPFVNAVTGLLLSLMAAVRSAYLYLLKLGS
ncbi:glycosyltransferase family 2 protein [candidate division KSB1 bacterium]|nr:glycosyltransferase family 2 protein [candidate division KSB1 bacterium]